MKMESTLYTREARIFEREHYDNCSVCGRHFNNNDTTHLGFDSKGNYQNVGDCCKDKLTRLIERHSYKKRFYEIPEGSSILWRYMDISKFMSLLQSKSLYFARSDTFEDPYEGAKGTIENVSRWNSYYYGFCNHAIRSAVEQGIAPSKSDQEYEEQVNNLYHQIKTASNERNHIFISCWHENQNESEAMWKLYAKDRESCIAIQTTFKRLYLAIDRDPDIHIGRVNYIDYNEKFAPFGYEAFFCKRKSFDYEHEVRMLFNSLDLKESLGIYVPVNFDILIENIYVSPTSANWFKDVVQDILDKYGLEKEVKKSSMLIQPFY